MLTKGDDYPLHQTAEPIAYAGTDRNFYDRYFFNGYGRDGRTFFAAALGVYPHLDVMDASFCVIHEGVQHNLRASRLLGMERMDTVVGPIAVEVLEPLRRLRVRIDSPAHGVRADLVFERRAPAFEEPRFRWRVGPRTFFDYTRLTQHGTWAGRIEVGGKTVEVTGDRFPGCRDRSWGVRPVGAPDAQPNGSLRQFYWLWAPIHFDDELFLYDVCSDADGNRWHESALVAPPGDVAAEPAAAAESSVVFRSGTRHAEQATIRFRRRSGSEAEITLVPDGQFYMSGLGYLHPEWGHGTYKGDGPVVGYDTYDLATVDEAQPLFLHVQAFVRATLDEGGASKTGLGVLEQLVIGPHRPSGFRDLFDLAP